MKDNENKRSNTYYLNEYSLNGHFKDLDEFFDSLREYTLPLLKELEKEKGIVFLKSDDFWQSEITSGCTLHDLNKKHPNTRREEATILKTKIRQLVCSDPYWHKETKKPDIKIVKYNFDDEHCKTFAEDNCFLRALAQNDNIISFWHDAYKENKLYFDVSRDTEVQTEYLLNFAYKEHLPRLMIARKWNVAEDISAFIRLNEPDNHKPHFHVESQRYRGSFDLNTGEVLKDNGTANLKRQICVKIKKWHKENQKDLAAAWSEFHENPLKSTPVA